MKSLDPGSVEQHQQPRDLDPKRLGVVRGLCDQLCDTCEVFFFRVHLTRQRRLGAAEHEPSAFAHEIEPSHKGGYPLSPASTTPDPRIEKVLRDVGRRGAVLLCVSQELCCGQNLAARPIRRACCDTLAIGSPPHRSQDPPAPIWGDDCSLGRRQASKELFKPGVEPFELLVPRRKDLCCDEDVSQEVSGLPGRESVDITVLERSVASSPEFSDEALREGALEPAERGGWFSSIREEVRELRELYRERFTPLFEEVTDEDRNRATFTGLFKVLTVCTSACLAAIVDR